LRVIHLAVTWRTTASLAAKGDLQHGGDFVSLTGANFMTGGRTFRRREIRRGAIDFGARFYFVTPAFPRPSNIVEFCNSCWKMAKNAPDHIVTCKKFSWSGQRGGASHRGSPLNTPLDKILLKIP